MSDSISIGWYGPTHDGWEWILKHFRDVVVLRERDVAPWLAQNANNASSALLMASESRNDATIQFAKSVEQSDTTVSWCVLLGTDWVGHRRTMPLPEAWHTFYWHELYDRLLPWLAAASRKQLQFAASPEAASATTKRKVSPRVQRWVDLATVSHQNQLAAEKSGVASPRLPLALIVTETAMARQLWFDAFSHRKIPCIALSPDQLDLWLQPSIVVTDLEVKPLSVTSSHVGGADPCGLQVLRSVRDQFPDAIQIVTDAFPRWERWEILLECGADIVIGKPFYLDGVLESVSMFDPLPNGINGSSQSVSRKPTEPTQTGTAVKKKSQRE